MAYDFYLKQGDTLPAINATLTDGAGNPIDLTGATVVLVMRHGPTQVVARHTATITNATQGQVSYAWAAGDTNTAGPYQLEWDITFSDGAQITVPNDRYQTLLINPRLG